MSGYTPNRAALAAGILHAVASIALSTPSNAQSTATQPVASDIVLTPGRSEQSIARSGSAVTVVRQDDIDKSNPKSMSDLLRQVPGISVAEAGGPGQNVSVRIRGAESRHTLVLIDGIRVNDPSAGAGEFDFASLVPGDIERIEVLRGPQSALYGSDAIGGVVNIITRKGRGGYHGSASIETGRYGTTTAKAAISGGNQDFDYAIGLTGVKSAGFSTYGYRIGRITSALGSLENDSVNRLGGNARFAWRPLQGVELELGLTSSDNKAQYDAAFGVLPDTPGKAHARLTTAYAKAVIDAFDGRLKNTFTLFGTRSDRNYSAPAWFDFGSGPSRDWAKYAYRGNRTGVEYQGDLKLDQFGKLIFGAKHERETLESIQTPIDSMYSTFDRNKAHQSTSSGFLLYQLPIGERFDLSLGSRIDDVSKIDRFTTWRATAAYRLPVTETKVRVSAGTGAKAPSLFQLYSPQYGTTGLQSERSFGVDVGFDQALFGGRANISVTAFNNRLSNLIDFSPWDPMSYSYPSCPVAQLYNGCYQNIAKAQTSGAEVALDAVLVEGVLSTRAVYTHLNARDMTTGLRLARRPEHEGRISFRITPMDKLTIEPSVVLVGQRFSSNNEKLRLQPYARYDIRADYALNKTFNLFARAENLTNARYQEVYNYGTTGRAFYLGAKAQW